MLASSSTSPFSDRRGFSLVEVVVAIGIFAVAVLSIIGLLLPNTQAVEQQLEASISRRLAENIQSELQRYVRVIAENQKAVGNPHAGEGMYDFDNLFYAGAPANRTNSLFLVATRDGSRVLMTGEDPYLAWNDTYNQPYVPGDASYYNAVTPASAKLAAENALVTDSTPGNPPGIAFRDRYYLIEVFLLDNPKHRQTDLTGANRIALPFLPLGVRVVWPYRIPDGPSSPDGSSQYNDATDLPWQVVAPAKHSVFSFNLALTP